MTGAAMILRADARTLPLADASVDLIVTSPPYFALRSYTDGGEHYAGQIGSEPTPRRYIAALIECTREWMRVLKPGGSIWVNLGDKYAGRASGPRALPGGPKTSSQWNAGRRAEKATGVPDKSLMMLPERYRIACVDELGLIARAVVIWSKPNGLPESVTDRVRRSHEDWVHLTKAPRYFSAVDEIREPHADTSAHALSRRSRTDDRLTAATAGMTSVGNPLGKLPGSVWSIASQPLKVPAELGIDHFAAFPMEWPRQIILGWSPSGICVECGEGRRPVVDRSGRFGSDNNPESRNGVRRRSTMDGGSAEWARRMANPDRITGEVCACPAPTAPTRPAVVLDPFGGTGTTALVAKALGRTGISVDMSADYCKLATWRTTDAAQFARAQRPANPLRTSRPDRLVPFDASTDSIQGAQIMADKDILAKIRNIEQQRHLAALDMFGVEVSQAGIEAHGLAAALDSLQESFTQCADLYAVAKLKGAQSTYVIPLRHAAAEVGKVAAALRQPRPAAASDRLKVEQCPGCAGDAKGPIDPHAWVCGPGDAGARCLGLPAPRDLTGLDQLIADSVAEGRGTLRPAEGDDAPDATSPEQADDEPERKTAYDWNEDPRVTTFVISWSDFGSSAHRQNIQINPNQLITRATFEQIRDGGAVTVGHRGGLRVLVTEPVEPPTPEQVAAGVEIIREKISNGEIYHKGPMADMFPGQVSADEVTAYLKGDVDTLPGLVSALVPGSVHDATEATASPVAVLDRPVPSFDLGPLPEAPCCRTCDLDQHRCPGCGEPVEHGESACAQCNLIHADHPTPDVGMPPRVPGDWSSETMNPDGYRLPGVPIPPAPLLGQPGDAGTGYDPSYIPPGGVPFTLAELLQPVPAAHLPAHLSHSQIDAIGECPAKYRMQRLPRQNGPALVEGVEQIPQWALIGGGTFHAAAEEWERNVLGPVQPEDLTAADADSAWHRHFGEAIAEVESTSPVPRSLWRASKRGAEGETWWNANGPEMLRKYLAARPDEPTMIGQTNVACIEAELNVSVPTGYGPIPFKAILDRATVRPDGVITIRDYKTGDRMPDSNDQLAEQAWTLIMHSDFPVNSTVTGAVWGTYYNARKGTWTTPVDLLAEYSFEWFQYRITTGQAGRLALTTGPTPARKTSFCGGCSVKWACPVGGPKR